jgi:hypothetical protein
VYRRLAPYHLRPMPAHEVEHPPARRETERATIFRQRHDVAFIDARSRKHEQRAKAAVHQHDVAGVFHEWPEVEKVRRPHRAQQDTLADIGLIRERVDDARIGYMDEMFPDPGGST